MEGNMSLIDQIDASSSNPSMPPCVQSFAIHEDTSVPIQHAPSAPLLDGSSPPFRGSPSPPIQNGPSALPAADLLSVVLSSLSAEAIAALADSVAPTVSRLLAEAISDSLTPLVTTSIIATLKGAPTNGRGSAPVLNHRRSPVATIPPAPVPLKTLPLGYGLRPVVVRAIKDIGKTPFLQCDIVAYLSGAYIISANGRSRISGTLTRLKDENLLRVVKKVRGQTFYAAATTAAAAATAVATSATASAPAVTPAAVPTAPAATATAPAATASVPAPTASVPAPTASVPAPTAASDASK